MHALQKAAMIILISAFVIAPVQAVEIAGVKVPDTLDVGDQSLALNGAGLRTRSIIKLYVAGLYLNTPASDPTAIISSDEPMAVWLRIRSRLVSQEKMAAALRDGFDKATNGDTAAIQPQIDQLMSMMSDPIKKRDRFLLTWDPATTEIRVSKNDKSLGAIAGKPFKEALFGIWLSDKPAQASLKSAMLGL